VGLPVPWLAFDAYGKVFTGPAVSSLEPVAAEEKQPRGQDV
jgi:hypothetical protein